MAVKVKIPSMFQPATGGLKTAEVSNCETVGECFTKLSDEYPPLRKMLFDENDRLSGFLVVFVNGESIKGDVLETRVNSGDEIFPMMIIDGG